MNAPSATGRTIATICARGGSKGLPGKNIRAFAGRPLIAHTIAHALGCPQIDAVYVSTDDERHRGHRACGRRRGALPAPRRARYRRGGQAAGHRTPRLPSREPGRVDPARRRPAADLAVARKRGHRRRIGAHAPARSSWSASAKRRDNPYFNLVEQGADGLVRLSKGDGAARRQDLPKVFALNGSIYVWQRAALAHAALHGMWSVAVAPYVMPQWKSVDIDTLDDFDYAQWLYERHMAKGDEPWLSPSSSSPRRASTTTATSRWRCGCATRRWARGRRGQVPDLPCAGSGGAGRADGRLPGARNRRAGPVRDAPEAGAHPGAARDHPGALRRDRHRVLLHAVFDRRGGHAGAPRGAAHQAVLGRADAQGARGARRRGAPAAAGLHRHGDDGRDRRGAAMDRSRAREPGRRHAAALHVGLSGAGLPRSTSMRCARWRATWALPSATPTTAWASRRRWRLSPWARPSSRST